MNDEISEARQALRDYAREGVAIDGRNLQPNALNEGIQYVGARGELAGMAAQAALTVAEELRAEGTQPITRELEERLTFVGAMGYKRAQREAADHIEAAVLKALA